MSETVFSKIIRGEIPCHRVFDDDHVLAFLDIFPLSRGHTLVIPKEPAERLDQLSDESAAALGRALPRICRGVMKATGAKAYNVLQNNGALAHQEVKHVHFHVIPRFDVANGAGLGIVWRKASLDSMSGAELAADIAACVAEA
jgi:histidine triad (HIT) family protein